MTRSSEECLAWRHKFKSHQHIDNNEKNESMDEISGGGCGL